MAIEIKIDRGIKGLHRLTESWAKLASVKVHRHFFHSWWYYLAGLKALNNFHDRLLFISVIEHGKVQVILPVEIVVIRRAGLSIKTLGSPKSIFIPYWDWIGEPGSGGGEILQSVLDLMKHEPELASDVMQFTGILEDSSFRKAVGALKGRQRLVRQPTQQCNYIPCNIPQDHCQTLSKNFRGNLRKAKNKLHEMTGVSFASVDRNGNLHEAYTRFLQLEASGWKGVRASAILNKPFALRFHESLLTQFPREPEGDCWINELIANDRTIASQFCLRMRDTVYLFKIAYDETCKNAAPGNMLLQRTIERSCTDPSIRQLNFVSGSAWHSDWKPSCFTVEDIKFYSSSVKGTLLWLRKKMRETRFWS